MLSKVGEPYNSEMLGIEEVFENQTQQRESRPALEVTESNAFFISIR